MFGQDNTTSGDQACTASCNTQQAELTGGKKFLAKRDRVQPNLTGLPITGERSHRFKLHCSTSPVSRTSAKSPCPREETTPRCSKALSLDRSPRQRCE